MQNIRNDLTVHIRGMQKLLENVYVGIGVEYGRLRQAMDDQLSNSLLIVTDYKNKVVSHEDSVLGKVHSIESYVHDSIQKYEGMDKESVKLVNVFKESFSTVSDITNSIKSIRDSSELMEVLALNAMVVAIKSGKNGGGFTYISDALKNTASDTIALSDDVLVIGEQISETFDEVNNMLESIVLLNQDLKRFFSETIQFQFKQFYHLTGVYVDFLEELYTGAEKIKIPVFGIMEDLQYQDIIRQSLDHITLFISELPMPGCDTVENELDELAIVSIISSFSISVLEDIREKVNKNLIEFNERIEMMRSVTSGISDMRDSFFNAHNLDSKVSDNMNSLILEFRNGMSSLLQDLKEGEKIRIMLREDENRLFSMIENLNNKASGFESLTTMFRNIIVLGRIEISKMEALKGVDYAMQDIQKNTGLIDDGIEVINERYAKMNLYDVEIRELFDRLFSSDSSRTDDLIKYFDSLESLLDETFKGLMAVVDGFSSFGDEFSDMAAATESKIFDLNEVLSSIDKLIIECNSSNSIATSRTKVLLKDIGKKSWDLRFDGIDKIVDRFTLHSHRRNARAISGGSDDKVTQEAGSISLF